MVRNAPIRPDNRVRAVRSLTALFLCLFTFCVLPIHSDYPEIQNLNRDDVLFVQLQRDIASYHRAAALKSKDSAPALTLFQYRLKMGDDLLAVAARLNLPYETITTLNGIESAEEFQSRDLIFIPNMPGIFVPLVPKNDIERIMFSWRETRKGGTLSVSVQTHMDDQKLFFFFPGDRFHPVERAYFLRILFHFPLPGGRITSRFGMRENPFGGHPQFHNGIDLAAEIGTDVLAAREGTVAEVGYDRIYGRYILVDHKNGYQSLYGHLSSIDVCLNQWVNSGKIIGKVGVTGWSTGPHLHFEIRKKGKARDPVPLLPSRKMHGN